jgi:hypothetical protein
VPKYLMAFPVVTWSSRQRTSSRLLTYHRRG